MLHDPQSYSDPGKPERILMVDGQIPEKDPSTLVFVFCRRACPGREFAEITLYLSILTCLSVLYIEKCPSCELEAKLTSGIVSRAMDFEVVIKPRNRQAEALIHLIEDESPLEKSSADDTRAEFAKMMFDV